LKSHFPGEAVVVQLHVERLLAAGLRQTAVAVITPYNAQVGGTRSGCVG
jgi:superfamily I DNA and/or RNA helicase